MTTRTPLLAAAKAVLAAMEAPAGADVTDWALAVRLALADLAHAVRYVEHGEHRQVRQRTNGDLEGMRL